MFWREKFPLTLTLNFRFPFENILNVYHELLPQQPVELQALQLWSAEELPEAAAFFDEFHG